MSNIRPPYLSSKNEYWQKSIYVFLLVYCYVCVKMRPLQFVWSWTEDIAGFGVLRCPLPQVKKRDAWNYIDTFSFLLALNFFRQSTVSWRWMCEAIFSLCCNRNQPASPSKTNTTRKLAMTDTHSCAVKRVCESNTQRARISFWYVVEDGKGMDSKEPQITNQKLSQTMDIKTG